MSEITCHSSTVTRVILFNSQPYLVRAFYSVTICLIASYLIASTGCQDQGEIRVYTVPKPKLAQTRILGTFVPMESQMIYVKARGPAERLDSIKQELVKITQTLSFDGTGNLDWETPNDWQRNPGRSFALAVLIAPTKPEPTEVTITSLAMPDTNRNQYLIQNYDRWRGQVNLEPMQLFSSADPSITELTTDAGSTAYLIDLVGDGSGRMQSPPFAGAGAGGPFANASSPPPNQQNRSGAIAEPESQIEYVSPDDWQIGPPRPFRLATFELPSGDGEVILSTASSPIDMVVTMWQQQLSSDQTEEDLKDSVDAVVSNGEAFEKGGRSGVLYIIEESDSDNAQVIMTAVSPVEQKPGSALYVKFIGTRANALAYKEDILDFVGTIKLPEEKLPEETSSEDGSGQP